MKLISNASATKTIGKPPGLAVVTSRTIQPTVASSTVTALSTHLAAQIAGLTSGKTPQSFASGSPPFAASSVMDLFAAGVHNSGLWASSLDLTCIPLSVQTNGVLITPQDMAFAAHYGVSNPTFIGSDGTSLTRTVSSAVQIAGTDILIGHLNTPLPSTVTPVSLAPASLPSYLLGNGNPVVFTNQDRKLLIGQMMVPEANSQTLIGRAASPLDIWSYGVRLNDSGSPAFLVINGALSLLTLWQGASLNTAWLASYLAEGPPYFSQITAINAALASLGSAYSAAVTSLSGF